MRTLHPNSRKAERAIVSLCDELFQVWEFDRELIGEGVTPSPDWLEHNGDKLTVKSSRAEAQDFIDRSAFVCVQCHKEITPDTHGGITSGCGFNEKGERVCYACCAVNDRAYMDETGRIDLYLVRKEYKTKEDALKANPYWYRHRYDGEESKYYSYFVTNWPDSLRFPVRSITKGRHNMAGTRYDVTFRDHHGREWYGTQYGDNSSIARCKRRKNQVESSNVICPKCGEKTWDKATADQRLNKCWNCGTRFPND